MELGQLALLSRIRQPRLALLLALAGALSFWLPDVGMHVLAGREFDSVHVRAMTLLLPTIFLLTYLLARRFAIARDFKWVGAAMLLGVWLTGGLFMTLSATASGGGFAGPDGVRGGILMTVLGIIPPFTLMESTYDGSGLALIILTIGAFLWHAHTSGMRLPFRRLSK